MPSRSSWSSTECFKLQVTVRSAECGEGSLCSGKGACYTKRDMLVSHPGRWRASLTCPASRADLSGGASPSLPAD
ncbi:hypothetical protein E2C01_005247 [Portunus trituberculatus]|uniref:Uncharacterized protein n=1 Tax=Portunus trituberculatus TaxID=210409 RepID=A0A5B7CTS0_PORTR|nr:hypothetical protein [Portunus trituberculatus]